MRKKKLVLRSDLGLHCVLVQVYLGGKRFDSNVYFGFGGKESWGECFSLGH